MRTNVLTQNLISFFVFLHFFYIFCIFSPYFPLYITLILSCPKLIRVYKGECESTKTYTKIERKRYLILLAGSPIRSCIDAGRMHIQNVYQK